MVNFIKNVKNLCKETWKTTCILNGKTCVYLNKSFLKCVKKNLPTNFFNFSHRLLNIYLFPYKKFLFHYSTTPTITTIKYLIK